MNGEVAVVLRIIHGTIIRISHHELALGRSLLRSILKIYINPLATLVVLVLSLLGHSIHLSLDAQASGHIHKEYLAGTVVCKTRTIYADRSLSYLQRLLIRINPNVLLHPLHQETRIVLECHLLLGKFLLKELLERSDNHLVFHTW